MDSQMTVVAPEQRKFFHDNPLPWGGVSRLAQATGYANSTVGAWLTGHNKMPLEAFDVALLLLDEVRWPYDKVAALKIKALLQPSRKPTKRVPGPPANDPVIVSDYEEIEHAIRNARLTDYQCMQLIRVLAS